MIGFLHPGFPEAGSPAFDALRAGLRDAGYVEGNTFKLEARWARGSPEMLRQFAQDLVQLRVDLICRSSSSLDRGGESGNDGAANDLESDPIGSGYASSLSSPGGNLTGFFLDAPTLCSKWLQQIGERRRNGWTNSMTAGYWSRYSRGRWPRVPDCMRINGRPVNAPPGAKTAALRYCRPDRTHADCEAT